MEGNSRYLIVPECNGEQGEIPDEAAQRRGTVHWSM